jgi:hypothetical protein
MSQTISKSFTATGVGTQVFVPEGDGFTYDVSGTFSATVKLERSVDGGSNWEDVVTGITSAASGTVASVETLHNGGAYYRFYCTTFASGTCVTAIVETPKLIKQYTSDSAGTLFKINEDEVVTCKRVVKRIVNGYSKVGGTAGWTVGGGAVNTGLMATMAASQTGGKLVVPVPGLKVGDTITGFHLIGQIESAGNAVTVDADLRKHTAAAADVADASVGAITQLSVTADAIMSATNTRKASLAEVVAADETFYVLLTATTLGSTDIALQGVAIEVTEA